MSPLSISLNDRTGDAFTRCSIYQFKRPLVRAASMVQANKPLNESQTLLQVIKDC
jgi:hypothetical protein